MNRIVITEWTHKNRSYTAYLLLDENRKLLQLQLFEPQERSRVGNIYVGYVEKIVPNIQAAFVRIADGEKCYLPLSDAKHPIYANKRSKKAQLCEGDTLLVQVKSDAVKTKDAAVSARLLLHGRYSFLTTEDLHLGVSKKLPPETAEALRGELCALCPPETARDYGVVFRTNAADVTKEERAEDVRQLLEHYEQLRACGIHQTVGTPVYQNPSGYLSRLKSAHLSDVDQVLTDSERYFDEISSYLPRLAQEGKLALYRDEAVSLSVLYGINARMKELLSPRVWLPSGANIIIEQLETLTFVDVNSGKNQSKKPETLFAVNLEAALELARQLRLRNISGIILVDFINVGKKEQEKLLFYMRRELKKDFVPANALDVTKLGLMELTRQKTYRSLKEILS